ncbi:MAG: NACHT domain-containing protein, partial [Cytophagales bacterium]|nr:NACHT domain-containing protein [Cytophagales bacterium]
WIQAYIKWFNREPIGNLTLQQGAAIHEYSLLARIRPDNPERKQLLRDYFESLCHMARQSAYRASFIQALDYTLQTIDSEVFDGDPSPLIELADDLLAKLDPGSHEFIKATYPTYRSTLYALHQALVLIKKIAPSQFSTREGRLYSRFKAQIKAIAERDHYYPVRYHSRLLEQSLQRLGKPQSRLQGGLRRLGHGLKGAIYFYQVARDLAGLDFDLDDFLEGCDNLKDAFARQGIEAKPWYEWHQAMNHASLLSMEDPDQYLVFEECLESLKAKEAAMRKEKDRTALRFGIVTQLSLLALDGPTDSVRKASMEQLVALTAPWSEDAEVMEGLLDGLATLAVHSQGVQKEEAEEALESLANRPEVRRRDRYLHLHTARREAAGQKAIKQWLGGKTLEDKLNSMSAPAAASASGDLFSAINSTLKAEAPVERPAPLAVHSKGEKEEGEKALESLPSPLREVPARSRLLSWLSPRREAKSLVSGGLSSAINSMLRAVVPASGGLFSVINSMLRAEVPVESPPPAAAQEARQALRDHYQRPDFAQVSSIFAGEAPKHVDSLQCQLMLIEQVKVKVKEGRESKESAQGAPQDDLSTHHERLEWVKTPIALEDLFKSRSTKPDEPERDVQKVLLVGEAGTGKTTLSRKLAYSWAQRAWGNAFEAVYVLPVRVLQQSQY